MENHPMTSDINIDPTVNLIMNYIHGLTVSHGLAANHGLTANPPLNTNTYTNSVVSNSPETVASNPRLPVNRYWTPVSVHVYMRNRLRHVKWFGDFQEGYHFAKGLVEQFRQEDTFNTLDWSIRPFDYSASRLEYLWNIDGDGMIVAETDDSTSRIEIFYEPEEASNIQRILEEQRRMG